MYTVNNYSQIKTGASLRNPQEETLPPDNDVGVDVDDDESDGLGVAKILYQT